ncbi:EH domain-binding protein 1 [Aedes aegypti]|uniref:BMERB domain-containing protein n=1 Tax=Aedes aegypti TaxID=7159 RepID=A0A903VPN0_AEDAE|nr:EH domain-binding protein 1 [Aedes aegypti]
MDKSSSYGGPPQSTIGSSARRIQAQLPAEPPACVQNAMMRRDKQPFTYTPGGIDLSQIKSPRMAKRISRNAQSEGVSNQPKVSPLAQNNNTSNSSSSNSTGDDSGLGGGGGIGGGNDISNSAINNNSINNNTAELNGTVPDELEGVCDSTTRSEQDGDRKVPPLLDSAMTNNERQTRLREQARKLIAETKAKTLTLDSPSSPTKISTAQKMNFSPERTISPINNVPEFIFPSVGILGARNGKDSPVRFGADEARTIDRGSDANRNHLLKRGTPSPNKVSPSLLELIAPKNEGRVEKVNYIQSELNKLEREQEAIDQKANALEKKLRAVMGGTMSNVNETEDQLMSQWFTLVNKKNALLRRQMQLNLLEQENDLEKKYDMLNLELRAALSIEDWRKTEEQREKEALLLAELVAIVDKRNELVQNLHSQEQAIEDDDEIERKLETVDINHKDEKCVIQ